MPETIDTIVTSSSDSEQPITEKITRKKKKPASKAYVHDYYLRHKGPYICQHCDMVCTCRNSLTKHQGRSIKCYVERVRSIFDETKHTPADELNPEQILARMEAIKQTT